MISRTTLLLLILFLGECAAKGASYQCHLGPYSGRILDMYAGEPLEGVVVHITYACYGSCAAGANGPEVVVREALTDANGEYRIPEDTFLSQCDSGRTDGRIQIFKPGYGYLGRARISCPEEEKEEVRWADDRRCVVRPGKYHIWELPRLTTKEEREENLKHVRPSPGVPYEEQRNLRTAISVERVNLGMPSLSEVNLGVNNVKRYHLFPERELTELMLIETDSQTGLFSLTDPSGEVQQGIIGSYICAEQLKIIEVADITITAVSYEEYDWYGITRIRANIIDIPKARIFKGGKGVR